MEYKRGDEVEVVSKEEGFVGSYYEAIVVTRLKGYEYIVSYKSLVKEDNSGPLRELVTADDLRPAPAEIPVTRFKLDDRVDAFANDGWWAGTITGKIYSLYTVFFETTGEEIAYSLDSLRVHQDWVDGKWIFSKKKSQIDGDVNGKKQKR